MFEDFEFNPIHAGIGIFGGILSLVVMGSSDVGLLWKALSFVFTSIACYFVAAKIFQ